eukprot:g1928.t1
MSEPSFGRPSPIALRRMQKELKEWSVSPPEGCQLISCEPLYEWTVSMEGPCSSFSASSIYDGEVYTLRIRFTDRYPIEAPEVVFINGSPAHPHIYTNGHICLDILYDGGEGGWSPALTANKICYSLRSMLASNPTKCRPIGDKDYCARVQGRSPKLTNWKFDDDTV